MLRYSFGMEEEADMVERAVAATLEQGYRTGDIMEPGMTLVGTREMGSMIISHL